MDSSSSRQGSNHQTFAIVARASLCPTGSGNFSSAVDYLTPGAPFAFYALGVGGAFGTAGGLEFGNNPFGATTINLAAAGASPNIVTSGGLFGGLGFTQVLSFDLSSCLRPASTMASATPS